MLTRYRRHAFLLIMVVAAVITPPDLMTLVLVTIPLYLLYELSVQIVKRVERG
jgi:sec-independent protein translocase protein TatC